MSTESGAAPQNLLGVGTWVRPGPATLVVRENAWVVLVPGMRKQVTEAAWEVLGRNSAPEEFLDAFIEAGELESVDKIKALLFGFHDGTTGTFGVKGTTPIAVYTAEGSELIAGTEDEPFVLRTVEGVQRTAFGDLPAEEPIGAPRVEAGIIPVRGFVHATVDPAGLDDAERAALAELVEKDGRSIEDPEAKQRRASAPKPPPKPAGSTAAAPLIKPPTADRAAGEMPPSISRGGTSRAGARPAAAPESSGPNMFDGLFSDRPTTPGTPPTPAPAPAPAPDPVPAATSAAAPAGARAVAESSDTTPADADAAAPAPTPATRAEAPRAAPAAKRRLVSTSLFDRSRRSAAAAPPSTTEAGQDPTASGGPDPAAQPDAPAAPAAQTPPVAPGQPSPATAPSAAARPAASPSPAPGPDPTPSASIPTPAQPEEDDFDSPPTQIAPIDEEDGFTSPPTQIAPIDDGEHETEDAPARPSRRRAAPQPVTGELENTGAYDDLFGKTIFRRIEDAAVRRSEDEEGEEPDVQPSASPSRSVPDPAPSEAPAAGEPSAEPAPQPAEPVGGGDFIDWVPGVGRTAPEIAQTAARRASEVTRSEPDYPQAHMAQRTPAPNTGSGPMPTAPPAAPAQSAQTPLGDGPMTAGDAGQQVGYRMPTGQPQHYPHGPADSGAAGHQVGFPPPGPPAPPRHPQQPPAAGHPSSWGTAPGHAPAAPHTGPAATDRHASAPHPVAPSSPPAAAQQALPPHRGPGPASFAGSPGQVVGGGVTLTGLVCPNGHANSPERSVCRACGAPLSRDPRTVVRPPLGAVTVTGGERFVLDRTAIIGRRPRASRVSGSEVPQLITVPSPQQDISRSHLELRLEGWHVVALDLGTTNGTTLHREGYEPVRLRTREGVVLHHG
ncbi:MAG: FHA domain-containing protein, partial [Brachybacterium sp.]